MKRGPANLWMGLALLLVGVAVIGWGLSLRNQPSTVLASPIADDGAADIATTAPPSDSENSLEAGDEPDFDAITDAAVKDPDAREVPQMAQLEVLESFVHDPAAFTQGLELVEERLFESTGLFGESTLREVDLASGAVLRSIDLDSELFAEGLTVVDNEIIQLTWRSGEAFRYDLDTFDLVDTYFYEGEGWGLCHDGTSLWMSNGSDQLTRRDSSTFEALGSVTVTLSGAPVDQLNELECVDGNVWANVWQTPLILEIDPISGTVLTVLDASALRPDSVAGDSNAVLNGIAFDPSTETFLVGGKLWPTLFRVEIN